MAKVTIVLEDKDLDTGEFTINIDVENSKVDDGQMTAAHLTAAFIKNNIHTPLWHRQVWAFAEQICAENAGTSIANVGQAPDGMAELAPGKIAGAR